MHLRGWPHQYYFRAGLDLTIFWFWFFCCRLLIGFLGDILILWFFAGQYFCHSHQRCGRQSTFHGYVGEAKGVRCPASVTFAHVVFPRFSVEDLSHHGLLDVRARGVTVFYIPWRQILGDFCGFRFGFRFDVLAHPQKTNMAFPAREVWKINVSIQKKFLQRELRQWYTLKEATINHETFHLPWEFSCHLTSTSGRWKLHCIHHSCSSGRFLDARIGGWLGSQKSFRKNVDEKPANFMILVDEHPSFSTINIAWTNLGTHQLLLVEMCNLCETAATWLHWRTLAIARR